jgi:hypothetical protein
MIPTSERTLESDLALLACVEFARAADRIRAASAANKTDAMTMEDIDAEVAAVRKQSRLRNSRGSQPQGSPMVSQNSSAPI